MLERNQVEPDSRATMTEHLQELKFPSLRAAALWWIIGAIVWLLATGIYAIGWNDEAFISMLVVYPIVSSIAFGIKAAGWYEYTRYYPSMIVLRGRSFSVRALRWRIDCDIRDCRWYLGYTIHDERILNFARPQRRLFIQYHPMGNRYYSVACGLSPEALHQWETALVHARVPRGRDRSVYEPINVLIGAVVGILVGISGGLLISALGNFEERGFIAGTLAVICGQFGVMAARVRSGNDWLYVGGDRPYLLMVSVSFGAVAFVMVLTQPTGGFAIGGMATAAVASACMVFHFSRRIQSLLNTRR